MSEYSNNCPMCGGIATRTCKCPRGEKTCVNGHTWHRCTVHNVVVEGRSDHTRNIDECTCRPLSVEEFAEVLGAEVVDIPPKLGFIIKSFVMTLK